MYEISDFIHDYKPDAIVIKVPDNYSSYDRMDRTMGALNVLCEREGIKPRTYTLSQIKRAYAKTWEPSKESLIGMVILKYPQLQRDYYQSQTVKTKYYDRLFEAILVGFVATNA